VFCFFYHQYNPAFISYPVPISELLHGVFASPKKLPQKRYFGWGACYQHTAQTAQFWAIEIISGANRHPSDVPFVCKF